jgi:hypothetical protein
MPSVAANVIMIISDRNAAMGLVSKEARMPASLDIASGRWEHHWLCRD